MWTRRVSGVGRGRMYVLLLLIALLDFCLLLLLVLNPSSKRMKYKATSPPPLLTLCPLPVISDWFPFDKREIKKKKKNIL